MLVFTFEFIFMSRQPSVNNHNHWTPKEHERFLCAIKMRPQISWKDVAKLVGTRNARQTRTHAQKYSQKLKRWSEKQKKMPTLNDSFKSSCELFTIDKVQLSLKQSPTSIDKASFYSPKMSLKNILST